MKNLQYSNIRIWLVTGILLFGMGLLHAQIPSLPTMPNDKFDLPIVLTKTRDLSFGQIIPADFEGSVTVHPRNGRTTEVISVVPASMYSPATFVVFGYRGEHYNFSLPSSATLSANGSTMVIDNFVGVPDSDQHHTPPSPRLDHTGFDTIRVGATLHVGVRQPAGHYSGSFTVIVSYD